MVQVGQVSLNKHTFFILALQYCVIDLTNDAEVRGGNVFRWLDTTDFGKLKSQGRLSRKRMPNDDVTTMIFFRAMVSVIFIATWSYFLLFSSHNHFIVFSMI